ncbi:hypothetical protein BHYA_0016g00480 [Botrytis hyacinthi]|uniref:Uncharacterized protein n=1 Tax=Botrytis hyacinthi TaxID=278943 RepID=A0A4Z1H0V1_9HELO|nr:hypothetical protein BHYA_0016g00480 [Botrytis hyacinthi]
MNLTCLRKHNPNVFRQLDPNVDPIYLQTPCRPQNALAHSLIIPRTHPSHNSTHIFNDCQSCEDDPRTGAHYCRTCIEAQYYSLQSQSYSQSQIQDMYYTTCECPHCDSGLNSYTNSARGYARGDGRCPSINMEPVAQQLHNTGRYAHLSPSRLGRSPYRDVGLLGSGTYLGAAGGLSGLGNVGGLGSLGALSGFGGVRDMRDARHHGGRCGLQNNRPAYRI